MNDGLCLTMKVPPLPCKTYIPTRSCHMQPNLGKHQFIALIISLNNLCIVHRDELYEI